MNDVVAMQNVHTHFYNVAFVLHGISKCRVVVGVMEIDLESPLQALQLFDIHLTIRLLFHSLQKAPLGTTVTPYRFAVQADGENMTWTN